MLIDTILKKAWKSCTQVRRDIFEYARSEHLFCANDIIVRFPLFGRASIFRVIHLYLELGVIRRLPLGEKWELYELCETGHHHEHMKCEKCHTILSFESHTICKKIFEEAAKMNFMIREHSLAVMGICKNCSHQS